MIYSFIERNYSIIGSYDNNKEWYILKNKNTNYFYLLKRLNRYDIQIYQYMKENSHQNIVLVEEFYEIDDVLYVIEGYVIGKTLEQLLKERRSLEEEEVITISLQIADALFHLHHMTPPIIHRDIKLSNIMIDDHHNVKLMDFDVARFFKIDNNSDTELLGTNGYAAPEQFGFYQSDSRSDIYSLGVVMNYLLTGLHPKEFLYDGNLGKVIKKCISFDPDNRYKDVNQLKDAMIKERSNLIVHHNDVESLRNNHQKKINGSHLWPIPGFRTKKIWKMLIALLGYLIIFLGFISYKGTTNLPIMQIIDGIGFGLFLSAYVVLFTNYLNIQDRLDLFDYNQWYRKVFAYLVYSLIIFLVYSFYGVIVVALF